MMATAMAESAPQPAEATAREARARRYARAGRRLALAGWALDAALVILLLVTGWTKALRDLSLAVSPHPALALLVYLLVVGALLEAIGLPLGFCSEFVIERKYGLSRMTIGAWARDQMKSLAVGAALGAAAAELFYWALARHPATWWLWVAAALALFVVLMAQLGPVLLLPLFYKFRPIENPELAERLRRLAARAGARVTTVLEWKLGERTSKANAVFAGWGATRRILLADTLLERHTPEEIETVVAHELGHYAHGDIPMAIALQSALTFLSLWVVNAVLVWATPRLDYRGLADFANLPLVLLAVTAVSLLALPLVNLYSRWRERRADRYALALTANRAAFISAMRKLAELNLVETQPSPVLEFLFHGHPSIAKRIAAAEQAH
ncbi:MAG TPA: M48 family metalloprotease [Candidatus Acidoferrales bacterium]|nr:M48 family metalloprotease [Candidatus Acidoferrales bacterium]